MINEQIVIFIQEQLSLGVDNETIVARLVENGWQEADIMEAFQTVAALEPAPVAPTTDETSEPITEQTMLSPETPSTGMSRWVGVGVGIVALGLLAGYLLLSKKPIVPELPTIDNIAISTEEINSSPDKNWDVLIDASRTCDKTTEATITAKGDVFGAGYLISNTSNYSIKPGKNQSCIYSQHIIDADVEAPEGKIVSADEKKLIKASIGFVNTCTFKNRADLTDLLGKWRRGEGETNMSIKNNQTVDTGDYAKAYCVATSPQTGDFEMVTNAHLK